VESTRDDNNLFFGDFVNQTVFFGDTP